MMAHFALGDGERNSFTVSSRPAGRQVSSMVCAETIFARLCWNLADSRQSRGHLILRGDPGSRQEGEAESFWRQELEEGLSLFQEAGKAIAALCHAPWEPVFTGLVGGRTPISYHTIRDEFVNAGGVWVKSGVTSSWRQEMLCEHEVGLHSVPARTPEGCEECLRLGTPWVHLRLCLSCGHVGCCDSSPGRHATKHARHAHHPVAASFEPGERWAWCYLDEAEVDVPSQALPYLRD